MKRLVVLLCVFTMGCATSRAEYEGVDPDGSYTKLTITDSVGPFTKSITDGMGSAGIDADGAWNIRVGQEAQKDTTETNKMVGMFESFIKMWALINGIPIPE